MISFKEFCNISESEDIRTPIGNFERSRLLNHIGGDLYFVDDNFVYGQEPMRIIFSTKLKFSHLRDLDDKSIYAYSAYSNNKWVEERIKDRLLKSKDDIELKFIKYLKKNYDSIICVSNMRNDISIKIEL